jgi:hypothetical protein
LIALFAFSVVGASVGVALKEGLEGLLLAIPVLVAGFLVVGALTLIWRSFCEFYVAVFRISDDLAAMRAASERDPQAPTPFEAPTHPRQASEPARF